MVSRGVAVLLVVALAQAAYGSPYGFGSGQCSCTCAQPEYKWGCCPGPVVEKDYIVNTLVERPYAYSTPYQTRDCYQVPAGVSTSVTPLAFDTPAVCQTTQTEIIVPTTEVQKTETPLCRTTCTTADYILQIPIKETTCTSHPLCQQCVRSQDNILQTVTTKGSCAQELCTQNIVSETPIVNTVCQDMQGAITRSGTYTDTVATTETACVQLPPYKCLKPTNQVETFNFGYDLPYGVGAGYGPGFGYSLDSGIGYGYDSGIGYGYDSGFAPGYNFGTGFAPGYNFGTDFGYGGFAPGLDYGWNGATVIGGSTLGFGGLGYGYGYDSFPGYGVGSIVAEPVVPYTTYGGFGPYGSNGFVDFEFSNVGGYGYPGLYPGYGIGCGC